MKKSNAKPKAKRKQINRPNTALEVLGIIDEFLSRKTTKFRDRSDFWDVLSVLRGPDEINFRTLLKGHTTNHLRSIMFPRTARRKEDGMTGIGADFSSDIPPLKFDRDEMKERLDDVWSAAAGYGGHFPVHVLWAVDALRRMFGISCDEEKEADPFDPEEASNQG